MNKREKLIKILNTTITSLKSNIVDYNWEEQSKCNCGVVLQAATGNTAKKLQKLWALETLNIELRNKSWQDLMQLTCSASGIPVEGVFKMLNDLGLSPYDIAHLEFMSNKAILKESGITDSKMNIKRWEPVHTKKVVQKNVWKQFWTGSKEIQVEGKWIEKKVPYYASKTNLIKYLIAWKEILKIDLSDSIESNLILEKKLLHAIVNEDYELAAILRDKINK